MATKLTSAGGTEATPTSGFQFEVYTRGSGIIPRHAVGFTSVEGLNDETDAVEYKEGNDLYADMLPGQTKPQEITLVRGLDTSGYLLSWRRKVREATYLPQKFREDLIIVQYDRAGTDRSNNSRSRIIQAWLLRKAWPRSYSQDDLNSTTSEITLERVTICHKGAPEVLVGEAVFSAEASAQAGP